MHTHIYIYIYIYNIHNKVIYIIRYSNEKTSLKYSYIIVNETNNEYGERKSLKSQFS